jgi:hypothetical protein
MEPAGGSFDNTRIMKHIFTTAIAFSVALADFAQVGVGTNSPNSILGVGGSVSAIVRTFTGGTSLTINDHTVVFTGASGASATLPDATTCPGRIYCIKNFSVTSPTPVVTVNTVSAEQIDGSASRILDEPNETVTLVSDGANWEVFDQDVPVAGSSATGGSWNEGGNNATGVKAVGTITTFDLPFLTNNTERMRTSATGKVGIGTTAPVYALQVNATANPLYLLGVQTGLGTDSLLTVRNGVVRELLPSALASSSSNAWGLTGTGGTTSGTNFIGTEDNTSLTLRTNNISHARLDSTGNLGVGTAVSFNATAPEKLLVNAGATTSYNAIVAKGSLNNYFQLNINNQNAGASASSDVVATADNGNETANYVDLGINGSVNNTGVMGNADDAYLYTTGNNLVMGTATTGMAMIFLTGGTDEATNERFRITGAGSVGVNNSGPNSTLFVRGSFATNLVTRTASATLTATDFSTECNNTAGAVTMTLPTAVGIAGRIYILKKTSAAGNNVTVAGFNGTETIDGTTTYTITNQYSYLMIQSDGTSWWILTKH